MISITTNIAELNKDLAAYQKLSGKTVEETLQKQGGKLGYAIHHNLKSIAPGKGMIRAAMLARLKSGLGIKVRTRIADEFKSRYSTSQGFGMGGMVLSKIKLRGKDKSLSRLNKRGMVLQALMVQREIAVRESGRGFLGVSGLFPRQLRESVSTYSRYGPELAKVGVNLKGDNKSVVFEWGGSSQLSQEAVEGLGKPKAVRALSRAITETRNDIAVYLKRKTEEAIRAALRH